MICRKKTVSFIDTANAHGDGKKGVVRGMKDIKAIVKDGNFFKGNLHSHTTNSDGHLTPDEAVDLFKAHGYSFLCFSEHDKFTDYTQKYNGKDFIILPGLEASAALLEKEGGRECRKVHHIHGILGTEKMQKEADLPPFEHMEYVQPPVFYGDWDGAKTAQDLCDKMRAHGCITTYNHPIWSRVREEEFIHTRGITALEIFNYNTVNESGTGFDTTYWDVMLRAGIRIWGVATDDNHNGGIFDDACGGYIVVQAPELEHDAIIQAIIDGRFYSSAGPSIYEWGIEDGRAYVSCSDVYRINFIVGNRVNDGRTFMGKQFEDVLRGASYELKGQETYIRVECIDRYGRCAWSNPIFLNNGEPSMDSLR